MKSVLLAKLPWLNFIIAFLVIRILRLFPGYYLRPPVLFDQKSCLAIEAGQQGWKSIEFKELFQSASEYLGQGKVRRVVIDKSKCYIRQVDEVLKDQQITHYLYDPRTGSQNFWTAFVESLRISILMSRYRVVPIVYLTDLSIRIWRCQSSAVSAVSGVVVTFMMPKKIQPIFPHRRLVGPSLMPLSNVTLEYLKGLRFEIEASSSIECAVRFTGSLYESRAILLRQFKEALDKTGHKVEILGRELGSCRVGDDEYWRRLSSAAINITTANQAIQSGTDWVWVPHMVYRYLEVMAAGSLLLAPEIPGLSRYFESGKHYIGYETIEDAITKARFYLDNPDRAEAIRNAGHHSAAKLIQMHSFWIQIDTALGYESFLI